LATKFRRHILTFLELLTFSSGDPNPIQDLPYIATPPNQRLQYTILLLNNQPTRRMKKSPSIESSAALRHLFACIEARYGGLVLDTGSAAEVITTTRHLEAHHIDRLVRHEATALHVKEFFPRPAAAWWGHQLARQAIQGHGKNWKVSTSRGLESSDVTTLGEHAPYNVATTQNNPDDIEAYFEGVRRELASRRRTPTDNQNSLLPPPLWPLDQFRLELDEAWPQGAGLARDPQTKQPFGGGLPRVMMGPTRWKRGFVHVDEMGPLNPQQGLFSANIYLQLPTNEDTEKLQQPQRALEIWPLGIRNRWDWYRNALLLSGLSSQDPEMQVLLRSKLGEPQHIHVQPGDLVLICTQRPHAAVGFSEGVRVSLQCFVQYNGPDKRLLIDT
jgi:hypothetical protein